MPAPALQNFPVLQRANIERHSANVGEAFPNKPGKLAARLQDEIALVFADAAANKASPALVATVPNGHGKTHAVKVRGAVFIIDEHWEGNKQCLKLFAPMKPADFKQKRLEEGGVAGLYGAKTWQDVDRIVIDIFARGVDVFMNGDRQHSLEGSWSRSLAESALTVLNRAKLAQARAADAVDAAGAGAPSRAPGAAGASGASGASSASGARASVVDTLLNATPKVAPGPPLGDDLEAAVSWKGQPLVVTSDRSGTEPVHVMIERRGADGSGTWWPIPVPDHPAFPKRGCSVILDGDKLQLVGGVDKKGKTSAARFEIDLNAALRPGFTAAEWKERAALPSATAWATALVNDSEALVVGGIAGFYLQRNNEGKQDWAARKAGSTQIGGQPHFRERSAPAAVPVGAHSIVDTDCVFVGPGAACDGQLSVFDHNEQTWFALPELPRKLGLGQLHKQGNELVYSGGFDVDGKPSKAIFTLDTADPMGTWQERGASDAVAGKARIVERDGKRVSIMVSPKGALLVHLE